MKALTDSEVSTLRTTFAAVLVALQRGQVPVGPQLQELLKASWDLVREPADPVLAFGRRERGSLIVLPFGEGFR